MTERPTTPWAATDPDVLPTLPWTPDGLTEAGEEAGFSIGPPELSFDEDDEAAEPAAAVAGSNESAIRLDLSTADSAAWDAWFDRSVRAADAATAEAPADEAPSVGDALPEALAEFEASVTAEAEWDLAREAETEIEPVAAPPDADDRWWLEPDGLTSGAVGETTDQGVERQTVRAEMAGPAEVEPRSAPTPPDEAAPTAAALSPPTPTAAPDRSSPPPSPVRTSGSPVMDKYMTPTFGLREPSAAHERKGDPGAHRDHGRPDEPEQERVFSPPGAASPDVPTAAPRGSPAEARLRADIVKRAAPPTAAAGRPTTRRRSAGSLPAGPVVATQPDRLISVVMTGASLVVVVFLVLGFLVIFTDLL
ncbi:MAG: hypothetical protein H0V36_06320 [Chloroflexi bacterium]|nr:hypothetical protein [Chloroflexota bacterium]